MVPQNMQFGSFTWPNNPERFSSKFTRGAVTHKIPGGAFTALDMGPSARLHTLSGCFFGPQAYASYLSLEALFREGGVRTLVHPHWPPCRACMTELTLTQEPVADFVGYTVSFLEEGAPPSELTALAAPEEEPPLPVQAANQAAQTQYLVHVVVKGDTLWDISRKYNVTLSSVIALNPQIKNPNLIYVGDRVRVKPL